MTLVASCPTQWNSTLHMLRRMLDVKTALIEVLNEVDMDGLFASEWNFVDDICKILEPFAHHTDLLQMDSMALSNILPAILDLDVYLQGTSHCKTMAAIMLRSLRHRFSIITNPTHGDFNPIPEAACLLDPTVANILLSPGMEPLLSAAKNYILVQVMVYCFQYTRFKYEHLYHFLQASMPPYNTAVKEHEVENLPSVNTSKTHVLTHALPSKSLSF